jgi:subtilase family serine protease
MALSSLLTEQGRFAANSGSKRFSNKANSASAPTIASVIALVNDMLLAAGKPVLGFLNPWLYSGGSASFTDITSGSASGCGTTGFPAQAGWDAVTGFGTPVSLAYSATGGFGSDSTVLP